MKRSLAVWLALITLVTLTACSTPAEPVDTDPSPTVQTTATTATDTTVTTTTTTVAATETVGFSTDETYFTLDLPREWSGCYAARETEDMVTLYELQNHQRSGQGKLFSIRYIPEENYNEAQYPSYRELGSFDGFRVIAIFPTDVQFDVELMEPYTAMQAQIDSILATFYHLEEPGNG